MSFLSYDKVPLFLSVKDKEGEFIFAEKASISVSQNVSAYRQMDDNILQICNYGDGSSISYEPKNFSANVRELITMGPIGGPPKSIATSINEIKKDTKITFPNGKHLYFARDIKPEGHDYLVEVYAKSGGWSLNEDESQKGYFEPNLEYVATSPIEGTLDVDFYLNTGNMPSFFNITGLVDPTVYPPVSNEVITGFLGDFTFDHAYLSNFSFNVSANSISQASASFQLYGLLQKDENISKNYYSSDLYQQQSVPHGTNSAIIGINALGMDHATSFSYSASINRVPKYEAPKEDEIPEAGFTPSNVSKRETSISVTIAGTNIDPEIMKKALNREQISITCELHDLSYQNHTDNSAGFMQKFNCDGVVDSQSVSVNSLGFLEGSITMTKYIQ